MKNNFWDIAENWYQRTNKLRQIAESETETPMRKQKAFKLYLTIIGRMNAVTKIAIEATTPRHPNL